MMNSIDAEFSKRAKARRKQLRMTLQQVADASGLAKSHIWELEKGRGKQLTVATLVAVSRALRTTPDYLTGARLSAHDFTPQEIDLVISHRRIFGDQIKAMETDDD